MRGITHAIEAVFNSFMKLKQVQFREVMVLFPFVFFQVKETEMNSKIQRQKPQNTLMLTSNFVCERNRQDSVCGSQADLCHQEVERASTPVAKSSVRNSSDRTCLDALCKHCVNDTDNFVEALFDGTWRSSVLSVSDGPERKVSSASVDTEVSSTTLEAAPSLDDVFDDLDGMLNEIDTFGSGFGGIASFCTPYDAPSAPFGTPIPRSDTFTTSLTHVKDGNPLYKTDGLYQLHNSRIPNSNSFNPFQGFNFGLVKGLENPSRGLITAIRRLCDLLSKPRSDHLDSVFVRLLNNALKEMEAAAQPTQHKRARTKVEGEHAVSKRQRIKPNKSVPDHKTGLKLDPSEAPRRSLSFGCQCIQSKALDIATETVDLTASEDKEKDSCQRQQDNHVIQKESFIALEDTVSDFMSSLLH